MLCNELTLFQLTTYNSSSKNENWQLLSLEKSCRVPTKLHMGCCYMISTQDDDSWNGAQWSHRVQALIQLLLQIFDAAMLRHFFFFKYPFISCRICYLGFQNFFKRDWKSAYMCEEKIFMPVRIHMQQTYSDLQISIFQFFRTIV